MPVRPHAFVAMPFGEKPAPSDPANAGGGSRIELIDFNRVYRDYIKPALELAGLEPFRADMEQRGGDIIPDMLQELLVADMVVADLTIDNPNVWYEVGVRHALRSRGMVLVCGRVTTAFDLYTDRKLLYRMKEWTDRAILEEDKTRLAGMVKATMDAWYGRKISPVYYHLPNLQEPDWKSLRIGDAKEFWEKHDAWERRVDLARQKHQIGDLLVLANEAPIAAFRVDAWIAAGKALRRAGHFAFALEHLQHGLDRSPKNLDLLREKGICLQRLALAGDAAFPLERARQHYRDVLAEHPRDAETWALLGRVNKDAWTQIWNRDGLTPEQKREEAAYDDALLCTAIESYTAAYRINPGHYYSGINAVTLMHVYRNLTNDTRYDETIETMTGAVRFAAECDPDPNQVFWAKATLGDLEVLVATPDKVTNAYKDAVAQNQRDWFALNACRDQLVLLNALAFRPEHVRAGLAVLDRALARLPLPWHPRRVILFSGHRIDAPTRPRPRFPADKEPIAAQKIGEALDALGAGPEDLALSQAAAGGDLLFLEACRQRGVRCQVLLPFSEPEFISKSILPSTGGDGWRDRYYEMKRQLEDQEKHFAATNQRQDPIRIMPDQIGEPPAGVDPFERSNLWLLYTALARGVDKTRFVTLWNGSRGDGPGGTEHMYNEVKQRTGQVTWIDTRTLWTV